jgi:hypothetical protein
MTRVSLQDLTNPTMTAAKKVAMPVKVRPTFWERPSYAKGVRDRFMEGGCNDKTIPG